MLKVIRRKSILKEAVDEFRKSNLSIGLVPTMGALHKGHISLIEMSNMHYDVTIATIFVNPTQFNNTEDLAKYPRNEEADIALLSKTGCRVVFIPSVDEIYANPLVITLNFGYLEHIMEGKHRSGHFNGVGLVVAKLLGIARPDGAYFGQKDLQQFRIISRLVSDLDIPVQLHLAPIVREENGLAMSSRNERLTAEQRQLAGNLYKSLSLSSDLLYSGVPQQEVKLAVYDFFKALDGVDLEYFEIVDFETLENIPSLNEGDQLALCLAAYVAGVRLIDNLVIEL